MKRYLTVMVAVMTLVLASSVLVGCALGLRIHTSSTNYQNSQYGYSLEIPNDWTTNDDNNKRTTVFRPSHDQMRITVTVNSQEQLNKDFLEAKNRGVDVTGMTPLDLLVRYDATRQGALGAQGKRIDWNEYAITTFALVDTNDWKSWVKTLYILDNSRIYVMSFQVLGYSDSEFEEYRNQVNEICRSFNIQGSTVIKLPDGKTIFDF